MSVSNERIERAALALVNAQKRSKGNPEIDLAALRRDPIFDHVCEVVEWALMAADAPEIDAAFLLGEREGLRIASEIVRGVPLNPQFDLSNGEVTRVCGFAANAIDARLVSITPPVDTGEPS